MQTRIRNSELRIRESGSKLNIYGSTKLIESVKMLLYENLAHTHKFVYLIMLNDEK
jgi:hypothetical protein